MTDIRPLGDGVLIRRIPHLDRPHGALWLPPLPAEAPMVVEVLAVGPGKRTDEGVRIPVPIQPGDRVLIGRWAGTDVRVGDEALRLLHADEVIGIVDGGETLTVME